MTLCRTIAAEFSGACSAYQLAELPAAADAARQYAGRFADLAARLDRLRHVGAEYFDVMAADPAARIRPPALELVSDYRVLYLREVCRRVMTGAEVRRRSREAELLHQLVAGLVQLGEPAAAGAV